EKDADVGANGPNYNGIHHFGFEVDDLDEACRRLEAVQAKRLSRKDGLDVAMAPGRHRNFEMKWAGPDEVVFDISHTGWQTLPEEERRHAAQIDVGLLRQSARPAFEGWTREAAGHRARLHHAQSEQSL